ncbi:MAG: hypothetical protein ACRC1K_25485 [Planctomycetia bacterium]
MGWFGLRKSPPLTEEQQDEALHHELMAFMFRLEQMLAHIDDAPVARKPAVALQTSRDIIKQVVDNAGKKFSAEESADCLEAAREVYNEAKALEASLSRLSDKSLATIFDLKASDVGGHRNAYVKYFKQQSEALRKYFALLGSRFNVPLRAAQWKETYGVFLSDFERRC